MQKQQSQKWTDVEGIRRAQHWSAPITAEKTRFKDEFGRTLHLRGVNLCANSKLPTSLDFTNFTEEQFYDHRNVSFIGRPVPEDEVDEHFSRLRSWGLTFVRLLIPWECLEHSGPGKYDEEFIDYVIKILEKAKEYGIVCFIDPHQDTWSRFSGGSGAPGWCFEICGMDLTKFKVTGAAHIHQLEQGETEEANIALWATNYTKMASATMFTLFWAGNKFAPDTLYEGIQLQTFMQNSFLKCYQHLASRIKHCDAVIGFEVMNEPHPGYIGLERISRHFDPRCSLNLCQAPMPIESFALCDGMTQEVDFWVKTWPRPSKKKGTVVINSEKETAWLNNAGCIWKRHGLWKVDEKTGKPVALKDTYFTCDPKTGEPVEFLKDFYMPFIKSFADSIKQVNDKMFILFEPVPNEPAPLVTKETDDENYVYAPHWYDLKTMFTKSFDGKVTHDVQGLSKGTRNLAAATYIGVSGARKNYKFQISNIVSGALKNTGPRPIVIGECGVPMDINDRKAFETGDYTHHNTFLDAVINAMEANLVNFTLWNYNPDNDNTNGDYWNGEDFSIFTQSYELTKNEYKASKKLSHSKKKGLSKRKPVSETVMMGSTKSLAAITPFDISPSMQDLTTLTNGEGERDHQQNIGGRALDAIIRVYAAKTAGETKKMHFDLPNLRFLLEFTTNVDVVHQHEKSYVTEVFIPNYHYGNIGRLRIKISDGEYSYDREKQTLFWKYDKDYRGGGDGSRKGNGSSVVLHTLEIQVPELRETWSQWFRWFFRRLLGLKSPTVTPRASVSSEKIPTKV